MLSNPSHQSRRGVKGVANNWNPFCATSENCQGRGGVTRDCYGPSLVTYQFCAQFTRTYRCVQPLAHFVKFKFIDLTLLLITSEVMKISFVLNSLFFKILTNLSSNLIQSPKLSVFLVLRISSFGVAFPVQKGHKR